MFVLFHHILTFLCCFLLSNVQGFRKPRILGGNQTRRGELTYVVGGYSESKNSFMGSIIDDRFVISAAHAFYNYNERAFYETKFRIIAGTNDFYVESGEDRIERDVEKVYIPARFKEDRNYDIAVVKVEYKLHNNLRQSLDLENNNLEKLAMPLEGQDYIGKRALAAGAGVDRITIRVSDNRTILYKPGSDYMLKSINTVVVSNDDCAQSHSEPSISNTNLLLCAQSLSNVYYHGPCAGDSGGPLVFEGNTLIGVVVSGEPHCNGNRAPGIYTRVTSFIDFIERAMEDNVTDDMLTKSYSGTF